MSKGRFQKVATTTVFLAMLGFSLPLVAGFFGTIHPAFDSFAHFRVHLAMLMAVCALPLLFTSFRLQAASALVFALAAFSTTSNALPFPGPVQAGFEAKDGQRALYRLLQMNLRFDNATPEKVLSLIGRTHPDVVTLDEVSAMWRGKLELLSGAYPHRIVCAYPNSAFGVAILSRRPFAPGTKPQCFGRDRLAIATVDLGGTKVDIAAIHLEWPWPFEQPWQVRAFAEPLASLAATSIMAGDCNATPWSAAVRRIAEAGRLKLTSVGPTWLYRRLPDFLRFAGLPIDQVFSKGAVLIHSATRLEDTGSDHLPVMVEFSLRSDARDPDQHETATVSLTRPEPARG